MQHAQETTWPWPDLSDTALDEGLKDESMLAKTKHANFSAGIILPPLCLFTTIWLYAYIFNIPQSALLSGVLFSISFWFLPGLLLLSLTSEYGHGFFATSYKSIVAGLLLMICAYFGGIYWSSYLLYIPLATYPVLLFPKPRAFISLLLKDYSILYRSLPLLTFSLFLIFICVFLFSTTGYSFTKIAIDFDTHLLSLSSFTYELTKEFPLKIAYAENNSNILSYHIIASMIGAIYHQVLNQPAHHYVLYSVYTIGLLPFVIALGCICERTAITNQNLLLTLYLILLSRELLTGIEFISTAYISQFICELFMIGSIALFNNKHDLPTFIIVYIATPFITVSTRLPIGFYYYLALIIYNFILYKSERKAHTTGLLLACITEVVAYYAFYVAKSSALPFNVNPADIITPFTWLTESISPEHPLSGFITYIRYSSFYKSGHVLQYILFTLAIQPFCLTLFFAYNILGLLFVRVYKVYIHASAKHLLCIAIAGYALASVMPGRRAISIAVTAYHISILSFICLMGHSKIQLKSNNAWTKNNSKLWYAMIICMPFITYALIPSSAEAISSYIGQAKYKFLSSKIPDALGACSPTLYIKVQQLLNTQNKYNMTPELYDILCKANKLLPSDAVIILPEHYNTSSIVSSITERQPYFETSLFSNSGTSVYNKYAPELDNIVNNFEIKKHLTANNRYFILTNDLYSKLSLHYKINMIHSNKSYSIFQVHQGSYD